MKKSIAVRKLGRRTFRPSLESLEARLTPSAYTVSTLADAGPGSLRAAITSVNGDNTYGNNTPDVIEFSVAGVIQLTSGPLPAITYPMKIDGTSAPGFAGAPVVEIDNNGFAGLTIDASESRLASLSIVNANGPGVTLLGYTGLPNSQGGAIDATVVGNYIGLALDGSVAANSGVGLFINGAPGDTIGGPTAADRNVISGNGGDGIQVESSGGASILGNFIGTDPTGKAAAANHGNGITTATGIDWNAVGGSTIGGTDPGDGNIIAFNTQYGVVDSGYRNTISENSIFSNGMGGIHLVNNDNRNQPAPLLAAAFQPTLSTIDVSGTIHVPIVQIEPDQPATDIVIEIFATPTGTPAGQGQNFIGSLTVALNAAGVAKFDFRSTYSSTIGNSFTATATSPGDSRLPGDTSVFSPPLALGSGNANTVFVASAYELLLDRAPDSGGGAYWANALNSGTITPGGFVLAIEHSEEYIAEQIDAMYRRYLNRAADAPTKQYFVAFVQAGGTFEQVAAALAASQEFYVLQGGTDQGFITGLYADVLNRGNASTADLAFWETVLDSGASRASVADAFLTSHEYRTHLVQNDYLTFLNRAADPGGLTTWLNALNTAFTDQELLATILGSPEGYKLWS
ncbi:MAG TPA: DUF4214 domain-containing protein [Pirellulales bacterium]|nr:DUF4214 domain-containing protein [Pirellulales bacterium]